MLLVHTAVGPHDLFLQWKAQRLAACGYAVLIVDMLGDDDGSGWEREWSLARRAPFWEDDTREEARRRMAAAHEIHVVAHGGHTVPQAGALKSRGLTQDLVTESVAEAIRGFAA